MDLYGRTQELQSSEWSPVAAGGTGLQESMLRLGLESSEPYPQRLGVPDCVYYMTTGFCGFGNSCRYNHLRDPSAVAAAVMATGNNPERLGEPLCQYYVKTGTCNFGVACKFNHPKYEGGSLVQVPLNIHGYPLRPGEKECSYYIKTGLCKFTSTSRPPLLQTSYVPETFGPVLYPPGVVHMPGWNPYSASVNPMPSPGDQTAIRTTSVYPVGPLSSGEMKYVFPERPGEPECKYYLKTGECKFRSSCRYHHPRDWSLPSTDCVLNALGLPLRAGVQACKFYLQNGYCKFRSTCKFDHPMGTMLYSPPGSSSVDLAVTPYSAGSLLTTLAPSSSCPELQSELVSESTADLYPMRMSSSGSTLSSAVGLVLSVSGPVSTSAPSNSNRITRQEIEVHQTS